ncbi:MAG: hypothetical protein QOK10_1279 [Pseudonocardiales bacterium]|nr:hypothetical protein [Pseudonocardiales bacterium]
MPKSIRCSLTRDKNSASLDEGLLAQVRRKGISASIASAYFSAAPRQLLAMISPMISAAMITERMMIVVKVHHLHSCPRLDSVLPHPLPTPLAVDTSLATTRHEVRSFALPNGPFINPRRNGHVPSSIDPEFWATVHDDADVIPPAGANADIASVESPSRSCDLHAGQTTPCLHDVTMKGQRSRSGCHETHTRLPRKRRVETLKRRDRAVGDDAMSGCRGK